MSWAKFDDRFSSNAKVLKTWHTCPQAIGLYVMAITHCAQHETDGRVDNYFILGLVPASRERQKIIDALIESGLWVAIDTDAYLIPDYLDFNPSRAELDAKRQQDRERRAKGRQTQSDNAVVRAESERTRSRRDNDAQKNPSGIRAESQARPMVPSRPDPSRPVPNATNRVPHKDSSLAAADDSYLAEAAID